MNVLSLFDGMSCGMIALERAGIKVDNYYASEIDKYAIQISQKNYPDIIRLGDVCKLETQNLPKINLLIGGSPCQGFSFAGKQLNFDDARSRLFFQFVRILNAIKPKYFLLENVKMKKESQDVISRFLGVEPVEINSALVSAQNRKRLYWTNIPDVQKPEDKNIMFANVIEIKTEPRYDFSDKSYSCLDKIVARSKEKGLGFRSGLIYFPYQEKAMCVDANYHKGCDGKRTMVVKADGKFRMMTPTECERLQTVPDGYTEGVSNTQRYRMLGNGWTVDVIAHIFRKIG